MSSSQSESSAALRLFSASKTSCGYGAIPSTPLCPVAVYGKNGFYIEHQVPLFLYYNLSGILWPLASFVVTVVATAIITYKLRQGSKFRAYQTGASVELTSISNQQSSSSFSTPKTGPTKTTTKSFQLRSSGGEDAPYHHSDLHRELVAQDYPLHSQICYLRLLFSEASPLFVRVCRPLGVSRRLCQRSCQLFCLLRHELVIPINISSYDLSVTSA